MASIEINSAPPGLTLRADGTRTPRRTPWERVRRRRAAKEARAVNADRDRVMQRMAKLGPGWHLIPSDELGSDAQDAFVAIGPGGVFAVTVKSHGRGRVQVSGDVIQLGGQRPPFVAQARRFAEEFEAALGRAAGTRVPVVAVLALAGTGLVMLYGVPRDVVVMPYRDLATMFGSYGMRIGPRTAEKLASIARHLKSTSAQRTGSRIPAQRSGSPSRVADKAAGRR